MSAAEGVPAPARSPTASAESDSEDSSDSEVELADPKESLRWLGYACRVCADAVSRRAPFRRRRVVARPRRAVPTACEKHATRVHARRSCSNPEPPLTPASRAPLHRAHRLVALASGRRPVSDGGFTGVRLPRTRARRARPPAPRPVRRLPRTKENPRRDVFARRRVCIPRERSDRSNAHPRRYTTAFPQGEHQEEHSALLDRFRVCVAAVRMQPRRGARGGGKAANPNAWLGSAWGGAMGRFGAGAGGAKPAVIRVGTTFQADVPPWRGPRRSTGARRRI